MIIESPLHDVFDHRFLKTIGVESNSLPEQQFDEKLMVFVYQFIKDAKDNGVSVSEDVQQQLRQVKYVDALSIGPVPGVMAVCNRYFAFQQTLSGKKKIKWMAIEVLRTAATNYTTSDPTKENILLRELMYHELYHCLLSKGHLPDNVPGLMNPYFVKGDLRAEENWPALVKQMFSPEYIKMTPDTP